MLKKQCNASELQIERAKFKPVLPEVLKNGLNGMTIVKGKSTKSIADQEKVKELFKNTYGLPTVTFKKGKNKTFKNKAIKVAVVLSGGQAPGGHNVIAGLFDGLKKINKKNTLIGYLGGPSGILNNKYQEITEDVLRDYRNTGGFDYIQSGRTKIETSEQFCSTKDNLAICNVDALVVVGGDDSNTNAAMIAEYIKEQGIDKYVIGIPKTIDGDLKNKYIETSFGFDTATKIYSELVGNICRDANSARKYWHFVRLMGRSASHITLEVGFKTQPNIVLIGEEILAKNMTLSKVVDGIVDVIVKRSKAGKDFGITLVPEGVIEFIPEIKELISALNDILSDNKDEFSNLDSMEDKKEFVCKKLSEKLSALMLELPVGIASQVMSERDPHGNVAVSLIETEKLLIEMVRKKLSELKRDGQYTGKFSSITHFFGYEGRCGMPSNFDANYTYALGYNAAMLVLSGFTGYMSYIKHLTKPTKNWECGGLPLTMMMNIEKRSGKEKPVIQKALVDLKGRPFKEFTKNRDKWTIGENYLFPGPIQYFGPKDITEMTTKTLQYEQIKK
ncbi:MAG: diphosphate--fructose-6-phosphate 1-phosphotransferase [Endomicrobium sp.]|jgi:pyrophosphate--fructose-6-phosphate 1-phosphotransferase|uniref:diphosphate--fructose-6-phosphate 1-phosphotransferase n=1 Tax=Candidatus Endomicrobiellum cubanum TaxID=3242325 RepID=UPI002832F7D9|nr:diphosphate--fructose-6-phosphate 1-phosphotransferase [Endomicrobium sp.]